ncbi:MAG TPA: adenylate/guanylate cyclase domain-containing protein [Mycobacteriales bacterium]|nr:adenylate/guanylate cyclase domain-containing protein [Mycobacteriales bacterium]
MQIPPVSYVTTPDGQLAWQSWGDGEPVMLDFGVGFLASIEDVPDQPRLLRWVTGLAAIGRLIRYDPPGIGTSDASAEPPTVADWADAAAKVLDAAGIDRVSVVGAGASSFPMLRFIERHPDRLASIVFVNGGARMSRAEDFPEGLDPAIGEALVAAIASNYRDEKVLDGDAMLLSPTSAQDAEFLAWMGRVGRRNARPRVAVAFNSELWTSDMRTVLPSISVPTLVLARRDLSLGTAFSRDLAARIPDSRYVEVPGEDLIPFLGDIDPLLTEIRAHLTGERHASHTERVFAAVLFTDLVGSTEEVARRGDGPWRSLLADHLAMVRTEVERHGGRFVKDLGDGTLCTFPAPGAAIRCAHALVRRAETQLGVPMRAGVHAGEIELQGDDVAGLNVHIAARVSALAQAREVLVSTTVVDLVAGSQFAFEDRGTHVLKGVQGPRQLWAARET